MAHSGFRGARSRQKRVNIAIASRYRKSLVVHPVKYSRSRDASSIESGKALLNRVINFNQKHRTRKPTRRLRWRSVSGGAIRNTGFFARCEIQSIYAEHSFPLFAATNRNNRVSVLRNNALEQTQSCCSPGLGSAALQRRVSGTLSWI